MELNDSQMLLQADSTQKKTRFAGLDLLKVVSMIFIIIHHVSKHGGFYANSSGASSVVFMVLNALFMPSVNVFVFTSAFLIIRKGKIKLSHLIKLYLEVVFYSILTYLIVCLLGYRNFSFEQLLLNFFPISYLLFWFVEAYLIMYALCPLMLKIVNGLNKKEYDLFLLIMGLLLIYASINKSFVVLSRGFSATWFCVLFMLAGYQVRFGFGLNKKWLGVVFAISTLLVFVSIYLYGLNVDYTSIFVVLQTISIFGLLYDLNFNNRIVCKVLKYVSTCTLGVYLLHDGVYIQECLYSRIFRTQNYWGGLSGVLYFMLFCLIIFCAGILVESLRKLVLWLWKKPAERLVVKTKA